MVLLDYWRHKYVVPRQEEHEGRITVGLRNHGSLQMIHHSSIRDTHHSQGGVCES